jgi:DNA-directed RNA polymerase subunit RPC12/RpoP
MPMRCALCASKHVFKPRKKHAYLIKKKAQNKGEKLIGKSKLSQYVIHRAAILWNI